MVFYKQNRLLPARIQAEYGYLQEILVKAFLFQTNIVNLLLVNNCCVFCPTYPNTAKIFKKDGSIHFTLKAYNSRVVLQWLSSILPDVARDHADFDPRAPLIAAAMHLGLNLKKTCMHACMHVVFLVDKTLAIILYYNPS